MSHRYRAGVVLITPAGVVVGHPTGEPTDSWDIFKGHVDSFETTVECALRELKEESGISITADDLTYIGSLPYGGAGRLVLFSHTVATIDLTTLSCTSLIDKGKRLGQPEMDGYSFLAYTKVMERYNGIRL